LWIEEEQHEEKPSLGMALVGWINSWNGSLEYSNSWEFLHFLQGFKLKIDLNSF
jgi:hypothetical protein